MPYIVSAREDVGTNNRHLSSLHGCDLRDLGEAALGIPAWSVSHPVKDIMGKKYD